ncbi:hypothetical protein ACHAWO_009595 [Cyclotella atomus]|uniref:Uncharacterized protein n=1 Tax=Cyclotella atomus TaxID=382360 RepID=A0ABD3ML55_9STRA
MRVLTSESVSSTEMNTMSKDENFLPPGVSACSPDHTSFSQQTTPRAANIRHDTSTEDLVAGETSEILRVTVLYLEGMISSTIPAARVSAWVGFKSSFPPNAMSISSSNYSSHFLREGTLLAVESDQVKWTPTVQDEMDCKSSSYSGIAFWDSVSTDEALKSHLEVIIPSNTVSEMTDNIQVPDILEFHVCIAHEIAAGNIPTNPKMTQNQSNTSLHKWDNEMEEVHWYSNDGEGDITTDYEIIHTSLEQQLLHGVAHLKVYHDPEDSTFDSGRKIVHLPIRLIPSRSSTEQLEHYIGLEHAATLTVQAEKVDASKVSRAEQRYYIKNTWGAGQECAPPSIKINGDSSKEENTKNDSIAKHFTFDTIKNIISGRKSTQSTIASGKKSAPDCREQNVIIECHQQSSNNEDMNKIQEALESSFKSMNNSKKLAAAIRHQRQFEPISLARNALPTEVSPNKQSSCTKELVNTAAHFTANYNQLNGVTNSIKSNVATMPSKSKDDSDQHKHIPQQQSDHIANTSKKTIMSRLLCGTDLADVMNHCDEDQVGMYVADSLSLSSNA